MKRLRQKSEETLGRVATRATQWIGSTNSIVVHTLLFLLAFALYFFGIDLDKILLVLTTVVSLEAIYLSIFIQMSVNRHAQDLSDVALDVEEIQEDIQEIEKDVDEIQEDVDEIQEDVEGIEQDVDELTEDIVEVDELEKKRDEIMLSKIEGTLQMLITEINDLKKKQDEKNK